MLDPDFRQLAQKFAEAINSRNFEAASAMLAPFEIDGGLKIGYFEFADPD